MATTAIYIISELGNNGKKKSQDHSISFGEYPGKMFTLAYSQFLCPLQTKQMIGLNIKWNHYTQVLVKYINFFLCPTKLSDIMSRLAQLPKI
jgi:hypothetical protein